MHKRESSRTITRSRSARFPLSYQWKGGYCRKIDGNRVYFGHDPDEAITRYLEYLKCRQYDLVASDVAQSRRTVQQVAERFLAAKAAKQANGELGRRKKQELEKTCQR